jgi:hypothetical protein
MIVSKPRYRTLLKLNAIEHNDKPCTALAFPATNSASQVNVTVSKRHGVAGDLGGSGNLGTEESIRFVSCRLMPLPMMSAQLADAVKTF